MSQTQDLVVKSAKEIWQPKKKKPYPYQRHDVVQSADYLKMLKSLSLELNEESLLEKARNYIENDKYECCNHNFAYFITHVAYFNPPAWFCNQCSHWFDGEMNKKKHQDGGAKNPMINVKYDELDSKIKELVDSAMKGEQTKEKRG